MCVLATSVGGFGFRVLHALPAHALFQIDVESTEKKTVPSVLDDTLLSENSVSAICALIALRLHAAAKLVIVVAQSRAQTILASISGQRLTSMTPNDADDAKSSLNSAAQRDWARWS